MFFEDGTLYPWSLTAENFLKSRNEYDILLMGWDRHPDVNETDNENRTSLDVATWAEALPPELWPNCSYRLHHWAAMHAYVISRSAMHHWRGLQWSDSDPMYHGVLDHVLPQDHDRGGFYTVR